MFNNIFPGYHVRDFVLITRFNLKAPLLNLTERMFCDNLKNQFFER